MTKKKSVEEEPLDPVPEPKEKVPTVKGTPRYTKPNEIDFEVHRDGTQARVHIISYDRSTDQLAIKAYALVESAFEDKKRKKKTKDVNYG